MPEFMIRFLICNLFISVIIGILLFIKQICKNILFSRAQYHLGVVLLGLLTIPFLPLKPIALYSISFSWHPSLEPKNVTAVTGEFAADTSTISESWVNDFAISVSRQTASTIGWILFFIWIVGTLVMTGRLLKSFYHLHMLKKSALPLQNRRIFLLYKRCLNELKIKKWIPIYSTAFLKSPMITGIWTPVIYLPIHFISDSVTINELSRSQEITDLSYTVENLPQKYDGTEKIRYVLLHELQHYKHKDGITNWLMNLGLILYWFNPLVWYAFREMRNDSEVACDTSVLEILDEASYFDYGNALLDFAQKVSHSPFPFASNMSGSMGQIKQRILNISSYQTPTLFQRRRSTAVFILITILCVGFTPILSTYAADTDYYSWDSASQNISHVDLSAYFGIYDGVFVLYDLENDSWNIYNMECATTRVSPDSTYKIYDALFGLEEGIISSSDSSMIWDGQHYPFETWNKDQTLSTAMESSVNWYFQEMDSKLGSTRIADYLQELHYGNEDISGGLSSYWMESSLKISPVEQVELLVKLYQNAWGFHDENINAIKEALQISSSSMRNFYGKTGTGCVDGKDVNGWFIGFVEQKENTYFFATNINASENATGSQASKLTFSILKNLAGV